MSKRTKPQKNRRSSIPERRLIVPVEKERSWSEPYRHGNDDALYNRADYHPYDYSNPKYGGRGDSMG